MSDSADVDYPDSSSGPRTRLITAGFILTWLVNFAQYLVFYLLVTTMALYAVQQFAASDAASGFASSAFVVGATLARLVAGHIVDAFGRRRVLLISVFVVVAACAGYFVDVSFAFLIVIRIAHGIGYAFVSTATMTIVQAIIPPTRRAEGTGYFALGSTLATALGPALGLMLVESFTYAMLFWVSLGVAVVGLVLGLVLAQHPKERKAARDIAETSRPPFSLQSIVDPAVLPIGMFMLLVGTSYAGILTYLLSYSEHRDLTTGASFFFLAYAAAMLVMRFILGRLQDRHGDNSVVYFGLVAFTAALVVVAFADQDWQVVVAGALTGLGYGTLMPASQAIAVRLVSPLRLGTGISTLLLLTDVGVGLGPVALGSLVSATSYGTMYLMLAGVVVVAAVFYFFVHGRRDIAKTGYAADKPVTVMSEN